MFTDDEGFDGVRADAEALGEVDAESQAVEQRARAKHAVVTGQLASEVGERVGWIGDDEQDGIRATATTLGTMSRKTPMFVSSSRKRPEESLRSVAPPVFSLTPAVIITTAAFFRSA